MSSSDGRASRAYEQIWRAFQSTPLLADGRHDTDDWRTRAGTFAICAIRIPVTALSPAAEACRRELAKHPGVRLHPEPFLHVTLQELGFVCDGPDRVDEISPMRLEEFANAAIEPIAARAPFWMELGGINSFQDAAFMEVHDGGACEGLHAPLFDLAAIPTAPRFSFLPHATIAHYTRTAPIGDLPAALAPWRTERFGQIEVTEVEILTLRVDEPYPPLESYAVIPLGG